MQDFFDFFEEDPIKMDYTPKKLSLDKMSSSQRELIELLQSNNMNVPNNLWLHKFDEFQCNNMRYGIKMLMDSRWEVICSPSYTYEDMHEMLLKIFRNEPV